MLPPHCRQCNDTGVIVTGNNDMPCDCSAGDAAKFNVCVRGGVETLTGAEVRAQGERHKDPRRPTRRTV